VTKRRAVVLALLCSALFAWPPGAREGGYVGEGLFNEA
jgi:hypothetical protein